MLITIKTKQSKWANLVYSFLLKFTNSGDQELIAERLIYSKLLKSVVSNLFCHVGGYVNLNNCEINGVVEMGNFHFQFNRREYENGNFSHYELIAVENFDENGNKRMAVLTADSLESELVEVDCSEMKENIVIDLNEEGRRWEGGELNGKPFGFGREYSEDDNLVYEGFVFEGKKVYFGKEWNDDSNNNCLMYEGGYLNGKRWGKGISYDLTGKMDYEGEWMNNHVMTVSEKEKMMKSFIISMSIEEFVIGNEMFNDENITTLHFSPLLVRLKRIKIGKKCFKHVREFVIDGLERLESVNIGEKCFSIIDISKISRDEIISFNPTNGLCRITNCPNLRQLEIGWNSFSYFKSFELSNVNSLQSIKFGNHCFQNVREFVIDGLESLESVNIGYECFRIGGKERDDGICRITNCPNLRQLEIGGDSFEDFKSFELSNVNSLQSIDFGESCFAYADFSLKGE